MQSSCRSGWETEAREPGKISGVSPELLACIVLSLGLQSGGTTWDMTPIWVFGEGRGMLSLVLPGMCRWVLLVRSGEVQVGAVLERRLEENVTGNVLTPLVQRVLGWSCWGVGSSLPVKTGVLVCWWWGDASWWAAKRWCSHRTGCCWLFCICISDSQGRAL